MARVGEITRQTKETKIRVRWNLDGSGQAQINTGIGFFDHLLDALARHGHFDLEVEAQGDLHVDGHHTVEDVGICLGQALNQALGERRGITRYGWAALPMDEACILAAIDLGGRAYTRCDLDLPLVMVGGFYTGLWVEFCRALAMEGKFNLHLEQRAGEDPHHILEGAVKALARALSSACSIDPRVQWVPSTKGTLTQ
ncbi:MAG: imidazoleglycerol-phosphate dehydratase HisB [Limnochordia bacterium]|jgi:imidazoleglycerol-phosphate dehydratase